jgi:hypothetical protein
MAIKLKLEHTHSQSLYPSPFTPMKHFLLSLLIFINSGAFAQDPDKTVTLKASGSGTSQGQAKNNALRSAVEQAYGAFISSKTEILNDQVVADEIVSVASGNIQSFKILEEQHTDSLDFCLLEAVVSISKLTSFAQSKGYAVEVQGGLFAMNMKQKQLNESAEIVVMRNALTTAQELMLRGFDYSVKTKEPVVNDALKGDWKINTEIWSVTNQNYQKAEEIIKSTLKNIALTPQELNEYKSLGKKTYAVKYHQFASGEITEYNLRTSDALWALIRLTFKIPTFTQMYVLSDGIKPDIYGIEADCKTWATITYPQPALQKMILQYVKYKGINGEFYVPGSEYENYSNRTPLRKIIYEWDNYAQYMPLLHVNKLDYFEFNSPRVISQSNIDLIYTMDEIQKLNIIEAAPVNNDAVIQKIKIKSKFKPDIQRDYILRNDQLCECNSSNPNDCARQEKFNGYNCCCKVNNFKILKHFEDNWKIWYLQNINNSENTNETQSKMRPGTYCVQVLYLTETDGSVNAWLMKGELDGMSNELNDFLDPSKYRDNYTNWVNNNIFCPELQKGYPYGYRYWLAREKKQNYIINQEEYKVISRYITEESKNVSNYPTSIYSYQEYSDSQKIELKARDIRMEYLFIHVN